MPRGRAWCFTLNADDDGDLPDQEWFFKHVFERATWIVYIVAGLETGAEGRAHYQGFMMLDNAYSMHKIKTHCDSVEAPYGRRMHLELAGCSTPYKQAIGYCLKGEAEGEDYATFYDNAHPSADYVEFGTRPSGQGKRKDIEVLVSAIKDGNTPDEVIAAHPVKAFKYTKHIHAVHAALVQPRDSTIDPLVYWCFGPTGTGKTRWAVETYPDAFVWRPSLMKGWWDGYFGQDTVIIDELRPADVPFANLLQIIDRYEMRVQIKGSSINLRATTWIITSPMEPEEMYQEFIGSNDSIEQLTRRITEVKRFTSP